MDCLLKVENLKLKSLPHLKELNFEVYDSEIVGIYSEVDSGQEQIIDALVGLKKVKHGKVTMIEDFYAINHDSSIYEDLTIDENISFVSEVYDSKVNVDEILELTGLTKHRNELVKTLPLALRKMSHIACVLSTDFKLLILEEPSMGLDDVSNGRLIEIAKKLKKEGKGILIFTSRSLDLVHCDRAVSMDLEELGE